MHVPVGEQNTLSRLRDEEAKEMKIKFLFNEINLAFWIAAVMLKLLPVHLYDKWLVIELATVLFFVAERTFHNKTLFDHPHLHCMFTKSAPTNISEMKCALWDFNLTGSSLIRERVTTTPFKCS